MKIIVTMSERPTRFSSPTIKTFTIKNVGKNRLYKIVQKEISKRFLDQKVEKWEVA